LICYSEDTGFRTKLVTATASGVVNIGYDITFRCVPEFTHGVDCLMAKSPEEMVKVLQTFAGDALLRRRLGEGAGAPYAPEFSFESQLPKYDQALRKVSMNGKEITR